MYMLFVACMALATPPLLCSRMIVAENRLPKPDYASSIRLYYPTGVDEQVQGLRARAQAGGGLGGGTAVERRQRQEIEGLKATIERAKLDAEAAKKKSRASERR